MVAVGAPVAVASAHPTPRSSSASPAYWTQVQQVSSTGLSAVRSIGVTSVATLVVTGEFTGTAYFPTGPALDDSIALVSRGLQDIFVAEWNPDDGTFAWAQRAGGTSFDFGEAVALTTDDTVLVAGSFDGTAYFPTGRPAPDDSIALVSRGQYDIFVAAMGADDSAFAWAQRAGGSNNDLARAISVSTEDTPVITGYFEDTAYFPTGRPAPDDSIALVSRGAYDIFVAAMGADDSDFAWAQSAGGTASDYGSGIAVGGDDTVIIVGPFTGTARFPTGRAAPDDSITLTSAGGSDAYVAAIGADDTAFAWAQRAGGSATDSAAAVAIGADGIPSVAGRFTGTATFPSAAGSISVTAAGLTDLFVARMTPGAPTFAWAVAAGGTGADEATSLAAAASGELVVGGMVSGTASFPGSGGATLDLVTLGAKDVLVGSLVPGLPEFAWVQRAGGTTGFEDRAYAVAALPDGRRASGGRIYGTAYFPTGSDDSLGLTALGTHAGFVGILESASAPTPPEPTPPRPAGAPTDVTAVAGDGSASVSWTAPADPGSFAVSNHQVTSSTGGKGCMVSAPSLTCEVAGLTNGMSYTFAVRALNGAGWGPSSAPSNAVTPQAAVTKSIVITGSRDTSDSRYVRVSGRTTDLVGEQVTPWIRFPGESSYSAGTGLKTVDAAGRFDWSRRTGKKVYVYFTHGSVRSNTVAIPAR